MTRLEFHLTAHTVSDMRMDTAVRDCLVTTTDCHEHGDVE